jgi:hypothetical protein
MGVVARILSWVAQKLTFALVLGAAAVLGLAAWIYLRDEVDFDVRRLELVRALTGEAAKFRAALGDVEARMAALRDERQAEQAKAEQAAKVTANLEALHGGLNRLLGDGEQIDKNEERLARLREMEAGARKRVAELSEKLTRAQWEKDGLTVALGKMEVQLRAAEKNKSLVLHYAREAWAKYGPQVLIAAGIYFLGPPLARIIAYFWLAPFVARRAPVRLGPAGGGQPEITASRASVDVTLAPADVLWVKERFLQASDEGLSKQTRWLLDWRMPLTSLAAGLTELVEMRNATPDSAFRATFSSQENAQTELALLTLAPGASLVLRPSFLAGVIRVGGAKLVIRRHWRLFTAQSWLTGQFRYFEFCGPCRLLLAGSRGVRAEVLTAAEGSPLPARRANQDATIGFTPGLAYRPARAETFWAYFRGQNPLFDDLFVGRGLFLCQETSAKGPQEQVREFWSGVRSGLLRMFGL